MAALNSVRPVDAIKDERGFSLIEVLAATLILTTGLLPLAALFAVAVQRMGASTPSLNAREKAREAIESVHAARDTGQSSWANIRNVAQGGVFLDGAQPIKEPGADGLVNTSDDGAVQLPAESYTREIVVSNLNIDGTSTLNPFLREVRVIVRYKIMNAWQTYTVVTYISSYS